MTRRHPEPALTPEQLRLAFRHLARPGWPDSLDDALAHPVRGKCIRGLARCFARTPPPSPRRMVSPLLHRACAPVPPTPTAPRRIVDRKRLAANDRDDD